MSKKCLFPGIKVAFEKDGPVANFTRFTFPLGMDTGTKLKALYKALDCDMVQLVHINIGDEKYVIFCDEEGKLKPWAPTLPLYSNGECCDIIANSFVVVKEDEDENFVQMTVQEFADVEEYLREYAPKAVEEVKKARKKHL